MAKFFERSCGMSTEAAAIGAAFHNIGAPAERDTASRTVGVVEKGSQLRQMPVIAPCAPSCMTNAKAQLSSEVIRRSAPGGARAETPPNSPII